MICTPNFTPSPGWPTTPATPPVLVNDKARLLGVQGGVLWVIRQGC